MGPGRRSRVSGPVWGKEAAWLDLAPIPPIHAHTLRLTAPHCALIWQSIFVDVSKGPEKKRTSWVTRVGPESSDWGH